MAQPFYAYILHCADGSYYTGHTDELQKRLAQHHAGQGGRYTALRLPVRLVWSSTFPSREQAQRVEGQIKKWSRAKKCALIAGESDTLRQLASRKSEGRALRDALQSKAPQECGSQ